MVVVTSSFENAVSRWVEYEWGTFNNEVLSGRKTGNLITVVIGSLGPDGLPLGLRGKEVIPFRADELERILPYVR